MRFIPLTVLVLPLLAHAQAAPELGSSLLQLVLGFGVVLAMLFGCLWVLKRISSPQGTTSGMLRVISGVAVGPRERVVIVEVDGQWLVLGVAPGQVSKLHEMPKGSTPISGGLPPAGQDFAAWLKRTIDRRAGANGK